MEKYKSKELTNLINKERGSIMPPLLLGIAASAVCAYLGSYVGEGVGWCVGNLIDYIPLVKDVAPWLAERTGLIEDAKTAVDLNENLYQTTGAIGGFWGGLTLPWRIIVAKNAPIKD